MNKDKIFAAGDRRKEPPDIHHRREEFHRHTPFHHPPYQQQRPFYPHYRDRVTPNSRPNFIVQLRIDGSRAVKESETREFVQKLRVSPQKLNFIASNFIAAALFYEQWNEALKTVVQLWEMKLKENETIFFPRIICNVEVPSDRRELNDRLRPVFVERLKGMMEGDLLDKWSKAVVNAMTEINFISEKLKSPNNIIVAGELVRQKTGLQAEKDLILKRVEDFKNGMRGIINYLDAGEKGNESDDVVFRFSRGEIGWERVYRLMMRESRRIDDGLPIYAHRRDMLKQINYQQVTVLIGETGSGKSTQLVQYLADSGFLDHGSIICTQPRKIAAISLAERVKEESHGCYREHTSVTCLPSYSSFQDFAYKVIFTTDHCLLQHYMTDNQLTGISCVIIDEAHERSLNTDLLLALIKKLLLQRPDLKLIIMSATADSNQFSSYFFGCRTFQVSGRSFPVEIKYLPCEPEVVSRCNNKSVPSYVLDVVRVVTDINRDEKEGTVLAFLTSQSEVEWACENFRATSAIALPLHGKLSHEEQHRVFLTYPGKRKVIFTTNLAETSLTIPGVKYVVDSGVMKESRFEPATGMNVLRVCQVSQSSANQRAGRGGRTEPGTCYRLYSEIDFESMPPHQEPEIRMVHLGVAVLRILALGITNVQEFDFVDAPSIRAIDISLRNLVQLGAVRVKDKNIYELTPEGRQMIKLGIEPRLGKIILRCFNCRLGREGLVLAAVMLNSSSIFCRVGTEEDKLKSDCIKVKFCHPKGDLFTLLAVFKEWESVPREKKNAWCWENSINAKSMRRCQDTVIELEACLENELRIIVPSYWQWDPQSDEHNAMLQSIILSSLSENVAMYSGYDHLGYQVALSKKHVQLHPSCSLLNFGKRPAWVVFGQILSASREYMVCVTACEFKSLSSLNPPLEFDYLEMHDHQLQKKTISGYGSMLLKRFCGKCHTNVRKIASSLRESCGDERIGVEVNVDQNEIVLYATSRDMEKVCYLVNDGVEYEKRLLRNECVEKSLYNGGPTVLPSIALFGAGAEIKHLELDKRILTVEISHLESDGVDDKSLLVFIEEFTSGCICGVTKFPGPGPDGVEDEKWGRITFTSPDAAKKAVELNGVEFGGGLLKVVPCKYSTSGGDQKASFPTLRAKISWPRRYSKGVAILRCNETDVKTIINDLSNLIIGGRLVWCQESVKSKDGVVLTGLDRELCEADIFPAIRSATNREILDLFLVRGNAIDNPSPLACQEAILRYISPFMPRRGPQGTFARVQVFTPEPKDSFTRAVITFDGSLHLEAAKSLEHIDGKILPGCFVWQKIRCQQLFHSSVSCPGPVYYVIRAQLESVMARLRRRNGVECTLERNLNGSYRVKISAFATKIVAELRRPLEHIMKGTTVQHPDITPVILQLLFSQEGFMLMKSVQQETGTHILFDKHSITVRIFGPPEQIDLAQKKFVKSLLALHDRKDLEIRLRNGVFPHDMMKRVVENFGPNLNGLKENFPEAQFYLNARRHSVSIVGPKQLKQKVEKLFHDLTHTTELQQIAENDHNSCPICLCELEDRFILEDCCHEFCRPCLIEQCESAIKSQDNFPLTCAKENCGSHILLSDLRSLLSCAKLEELFRASLGSFVTASGGNYRFCPSPDCPSVYRVAGPDQPGDLFVCGACLGETCTRCHLEYHPFLSCERYKEFKDNPDSSLKEWCMGKENVKMCPVCGFTIEKVEGCNHIECRCGKHVCWVCLEYFKSSDDCYEHLRGVHLAIV